jgi:hypothetical protein
MADIVNAWGLAGQALPGIVSDNAYNAIRTDRRGAVYTHTLGKPVYAMADEGSYFYASNPTPGTGIAGIAATGAFSDAESLLLIKNDNTDGKRVYLDWLKLRVTAAGTDGTDHHFVSKIDSVARYTSGGSAITPVNVNMDSTATSGCTMYFGALVTTATTTARLVGNGVLRRATIVVAGDEFYFDFGGRVPAGTRTGTLAADSTTNVSTAVGHAPVVLGANQSFVLGVHAASQSAATSYEFALTYWVR